MDVLQLDLGEEDSTEPLKPPAAVMAQDAPRLARPPTVRTEGRLSTAEYLDIVNEPIADEEDQYGIRAV